MIQKKRKIKVALKISIVITILFVMVCLVLISYLYTNSRRLVIAHAGYGVDGYSYLNVCETFDCCYNQGVRIFEYDFMMTACGEDIFGNHDFEYLPDYSYENKPTASEVENITILDKYTLITMDFFIEILSTYSDVKILLDCKDEDDVANDYLFVQTKICEVDPVLLERVIHQFYSEQEYLDCQELLYTSLAYTNYRSGYSTNKMIKLIDSDDRFDYIVFSYNTISRYNCYLLKQTGASLITHTIDTNFDRFISYCNGIDYVISNKLS